jgi:hypothetical protein
MFMKSYDIQNSSYSQKTLWTATSGLGLSNVEEEENENETGWV